MMKRIIAYTILFFSGSLLADSFNTKNLKFEISCDVEEQEVSFEHSDGFNFNSAYLILNSVLLTNQSMDVIEKNIQAWGFEKSFVFNDDKKNPEGFLAVKEDYALLSIRGTATFKEAISDILFAPVKTNDPEFPGMYHTGFWRIYKHRINLLLTAVEKLELSKDKPIYIGGHSLGSAVASLLAHKLDRLGYNVHSLYLLSPPRMGDAEATRNLSSGDYNIFQLSQKDDIVSHLPMTIETVDIFARLGKKLGLGLDNVAREIIPQINYRPYEVDVFKLFDYDFLTDDASEIDLVADELDYWLAIEKVLNKTPTKQWVDVLSSYAQFHSSDINICMYRSIIKNKL